MRCRDFRIRLDEFLDCALAGRETSEMEDHLESCADCQDIYEEAQFVRGLLAERMVLSRVAADQVLRTVRQQRLRARLESFRSRVRSYFRDLELLGVWTKVAGLPLTVLFFFSLMLQFAPERLESIGTLSFSTRVLPSSDQPLLVLNVELVPSRRELDGLIDAAWRLPYEDSLSLVAQITPDGKTEIDDVLEYPRSGALFRAVDETLRGSRLTASSQMGESTYVLFSLQKIDVYERETSF